MALDMEVGLGSRPHCARLGPSFPPKKGEEPPQFSAHAYCGQTVVCIMIPLGAEIRLSLGDIVLDGGPAPLPLKGHSHPIFGQRMAKRLDGLRCHWVWR